ncbi:hypothetical protein ACN28S_02650 [Cystobacter fuscus]
MRPLRRGQVQRRPRGPPATTERRPYRRVPRSLRPSAQPLHALSSWLASLEPGPSAPSATGLAVNPHVAAACVLSFLTRHEDLSLLLVVDPLEELVTTCPDDATRRAFLQALGALLHLSHPRLRMLWLLRSDFEPHFHSLLPPSGVTSALWHEGRLPLPPMNRDELRQCIEKPAESCVLFFEPGLVERLLDDVDQMPGALPLLSVALSELFDACLASGREDRTLSFEDYRSIGGGIAGALQRRAELVFAGTPPPASDGQSLPPLPRPGELPAFQHTLRNVLLRMVSPEEGGLARRRVPRAELEYTHPEENARVQRALRTLEACRLVVASDDGGPCVEPAHDALLSAGPGSTTGRSRRGASCCRCVASPMPRPSGTATAGTATTSGRMDGWSNWASHRWPCAARPCRWPWATCHLGANPPNRWSSTPSRVDSSEPARRTGASCAPVAPRSRSRWALPSYCSPWWRSSRPTGPRPRLGKPRPVPGRPSGARKTPSPARGRRTSRRRTPNATPRRPGDRRPRR